MANADSNALTIADYAMMSNDPLVLKITKSLLIQGAIFGDIPYVTKKTLKVNGVRWQDNLPSVTWAKLNTGLTVTKGKPTAYEEQAFFVRNAIDVDLAYLEDENRIGDPRAQMLEAYIQGVVYDYNNKFINNNPIDGEDDAIVGLRYRLDNYDAYRVHSDMIINGGGVDMTQAAMTAATANNFLEFIEQQLTVMGAPEGDGVVFYCNELLKRRWERAIRLLGAGAGWSMQRDAFDRAITMYKNAKIVVIGRTADQTTQIITNTESSAGAAGSSTYTSLYAVKYGEEAFMGWQWDSLPNSIQDIGLIGNDGVTARIKIDWGNGILPQSNRCLSRIYGIKVS